MELKQVFQEIKKSYTMSRCGAVLVDDRPSNLDDLVSPDVIRK